MINPSLFVLCVALGWLSERDAKRALAKDDSPMNVAPPSQRRGRVPEPRDDQPRDDQPREFTAEEAARAQSLEARRAAVAQVDRGPLTFELARLHYDAHHWLEAAALYDEVAGISCPQRTYAAMLSLDAINMAIGIETDSERRAALMATLADRARRYHATLCGDTAEPEEICATLTEIEAAVERRSQSR
jgi:hypothetical protein